MNEPTSRPRHGATPDGMALDGADHSAAEYIGADEIRRDSRRELWLIPQALLAFAVVAAIAIVRELVLR